MHIQTSRLHEYDCWINSGTQQLLFLGVNSLKLEDWTACPLAMCHTHSVAEPGALLPVQTKSFSFGLPTEHPNRGRLVGRRLWRTGIINHFISSSASASSAVYYPAPPVLTFRMSASLAGIDCV